MWNIYLTLRKIPIDRKKKKQPSDNKLLWRKFPAPDAFVNGVNANIYGIYIF